MSIFHNNVRRYIKSVPPVKRPVNTNLEQPLIISNFTKQMTTETYDFLQLYYHGGGIYTAVTYTHNKGAFKVTHGSIVHQLLNYPGGIKKLKIVENPITKEPLALNLHIKTIGTFVVNDDADLKAQLTEKGVSAAQFEDKTFQLIDARHGSEEHDVGRWFSPTSQFIEFLLEPNGDFIKTQLEAFNKYPNIPKDSDRLVHQILNRFLPKLQNNLFYETIQPCIQQLS